MKQHLNLEEQKQLQAKKQRNQKQQTLGQYYHQQPLEPTILENKIKDVQEAINKLAREKNLLEQGLKRQKKVQK